MKKLLKAYGLNSDMQYMEMVADSYINGQRTQATEQFKAMPKESRKSMVKMLYTEVWGRSTPDMTAFFYAAL